MDLEFAIRGAAASFATGPAAEPKHAVTLALPIPDAPHLTFLQTTAADIASASAPSWAHGMVTRATPLASSHSVPGRLLSVDPIALIAVRRNAANISSLIAWSEFWMISSVNGSEPVMT